MSASINYKLHTLINRLDTHAQAHLQKRFSISYSRFLMLRAVGNLSSPTQHQIAQSLRISDPSASRMLKLLETDGYITSATSSRHKRHNVVSLTEQGGKVIRDAELYLAKQFDHLLILANVSSPELGAIVDSLNMALDKTETGRVL